MKTDIEQRAVKTAAYMVQTKATVRQTAQVFGVSKSTVHKDVSTVLKRVNLPLYRRVQQVLCQNKKERHIRGGLATQKKYRQQQKSQNSKTN